jgi:hypothetical protein
LRADQGRQPARQPCHAPRGRKEVQEAIDLTTSIATIGLDEKTGGTQ